jgi:hypothetical protein
MSIPVATLIAAALAFIAALINLVLTFVKRRDHFAHSFFTQKLALYSEITDHLARIAMHWDHVASGKRAQYPVTSNEMMTEIALFQEQVFPRCMATCDRKSLKYICEVFAAIDRNSTRMEISQLSGPVGEAIDALRQELHLNKIKDVTDRILDNTSLFSKIFVRIIGKGKE